MVEKLTKEEAKMLKAFDAATSQNKLRLDDKQAEVLMSALRKRISGYPTGKSVGAITDDLGVRGVFNPADGKTYDSKSAYYKAVKARGLEIVGNDASVTKPQPKKTHDINWNAAVKETLQQLK